MRDARVRLHAWVHHHGSREDPWPGDLALACGYWYRFTGVYWEPRPALTRTWRLRKAHAAKMATMTPERSRSSLELNEARWRELIEESK